MVKPACLKIPYITTRHLPYSPGEASCEDKYLDGGVLAKREPVWLESPRDLKSGEIVVHAFVEHLGVIALDVRSLVDLGKHVPKSIQEWRESKPPLNQEAHEVSPQNEPTKSLII